MIFPSLKGIKNANGALAFSWVIGVGRPAVFARAWMVCTLTDRHDCVTFALKDHLGDVKG